MSVRGEFVETQDGALLTERDDPRWVEARGRKKPSGWTDSEFSDINQDEWKGTQSDLIDLVKRAGPLVKVVRMFGLMFCYLHFEHIILDIDTDSRFSGIGVEPVKNKEGKLMGYDIVFTHPDDLVRCWIHPDENYAREGKQIYIIRASGIREMPPYDSDTDDMSELDAIIDAYGATFKSDALSEPVRVNFLLPSAQ